MEKGEKGVWGMISQLISYLVASIPPPPLTPPSALNIKYMMGKKIQFWDDRKEYWIECSNFYCGNLLLSNPLKIRVKPEGAFVGGELVGQLCYVNDKGISVPVPE